MAGRKKPMYFLFYFSVTLLISGNHGQLRVYDEEGRAISAHMGMISDHLASTSSLVSQLLRRSDDIKESEAEQRSVEGGSESLIRNAYRWKTGKRPYSRIASQNPPTYEPEPVLYICDNPDNCPPPPSALSQERPLPPPSYDINANTTTETPTLHYGFKTINSSSLLDDENGDEKPLKTIFRSQIRKKGRKRLRKNKYAGKDLSNMSLQELQDFMKQKTTPSTITTVELMDNEELKDDQVSKLIEVMASSEEQEENVEEEEEEEEEKKGEFRELMKIGTTQSTTATTESTTMSSDVEEMIAHMEGNSFQREKVTEMEKILEEPSALGPIELMMKEIKKLGNLTSDPETMSPLEVMMTQLRHQIQESETNIESTSDNEEKGTLHMFMNNLQNLMETSSVIPTAASTTTTTTTTVTAIPTFSPFELMMMNLRRQTTPFTVRPTPRTTTTTPTTTTTTTTTTTPTPTTSPIINSHFDLRNLMKLKSQMKGEKKEVKTYPPRKLKPYKAVPDQDKEEQLNKLIKFMENLEEKKEEEEPDSGFRTSKPELDLNLEEEEMQDQVSRPVRRPTKPHIRPTPFTVRPTVRYQRLTTTSTPFTVRPTRRYQQSYVSHKTPVNYYTTALPYRVRNYESTTPFTVWNHRYKIKNHEYHTTTTTTATTVKPTYYDVQLKDPFEYHEFANEGGEYSQEAFLKHFYDLKSNNEPAYITHDEGYDHSTTYEHTTSKPHLNEFKIHPFEPSSTSKPLDGFQQLHSTFEEEHDDRPVLGYFSNSGSDPFSTYGPTDLHTKDVHEEEFPNYDLSTLISDTENGYNDFSNYDLNTFIGNTENEHNNEFSNYDLSALLGDTKDGTINNNDDKFLLNDDYDEEFEAFEQNVAKFPEIPDFSEEIIEEEKEHGHNTDPFEESVITLPPSGQFPDIPENVYRDLVGMEAPHPDYPTLTEHVHKELAPPPPVPTSSEYIDPYLKNPFGSDFIRLEVDGSKFFHNKTHPGSVHIPLMIQGYEVSNMEDSNKPIKMIRKKPSKPTSTTTKPIFQMQNILPMKNILRDLGTFRDAMFNFPHAVQDLPKFMKNLVSHQATFAGRAFTNQQLKENSEKS